MSPTRLMEIYEAILHDAEWTAWMDKIRNSKDGSWETLMCDHGIGHTLSVVERAEEFLVQIKADDREVQMARIGGLLHDIGNVSTRQGHAEHSYVMAKKYLDKYPMKPTERELVLHAIRDHSSGLEMNSRVDMAVLLGDKLDVRSSRVRDGVELNELSLELKKIQSTEFLVGEMEASLNYLTEDSFDISILRLWKKSVKIPKKVAEHLGLGFRLLKNNQEVDFAEIIK